MELRLDPLRKMDDDKESLGKALRSAREAAGISEDDAVYFGKMPRGVIQALESEDFGYFNSPLYARSFLQQYGDYVGLDVEHWIDDIEPTAMIDGDDLESLIDLSAPAAAPVIHEKPQKKKSGGSMAAIWLILITGGLVYGGVKIFENFDKQLSVDDPIVENDDAPEKTDETAATEETPEPELTEPNEEKTPDSNEPEAPRRAIVIELPEE